MTDERLQLAADTAALERAVKAGSVMSERIRVVERAVRDAQEAELAFWRERANAAHLLEDEE